MSKPVPLDLFAPRPSNCATARTSAELSTARDELTRALVNLPPLEHDPAPWACSRGRSGISSVNTGLDSAAPKVRFEAREHCRRNAPIVAAAPSLYNLNLELLYALVSAPRDTVVDHTIGLACDTLAAIHHHSLPGGADAARALRRAARVEPEPRAPADGGPVWFEEEE